MLRKINLPTQFMHEGRLFGPGVVEIEDEDGDNKRVADDLETAVKRHFQLKSRGYETTPPPNAVLTQQLEPGQRPPPPGTMTGQTGAEVAAEQKAAADQAAAEAQQRDQQAAAERGEELTGKAAAIQNESGMPPSQQQGQNRGQQQGQNRSAKGK